MRALLSGIAGSEGARRVLSGGALEARDLAWPWRLRGFLVTASSRAGFFVTDVVTCSRFLGPGAARAVLPIVRVLLCLEPVAVASARVTKGGRLR